MVSSSAKSGFSLLALWLVIKKLPSYFSCHHLIFYMEFENNEKHFGASVHLATTRARKKACNYFLFFLYHVTTSMVQLANGGTIMAIEHDGPRISSSVIHIPMYSISTLL